MCTIIENASHHPVLVCSLAYGVARIAADTKMWPYLRIPFVVLMRTVGWPLIIGARDQSAWRLILGVSLFLTCAVAGDVAFGSQLHHAPDLHFQSSKRVHNGLHIVGTYLTSLQI